MRAINNSPRGTTANGSQLTTMFYMIITRELQNLAMVSELDSKGIIKLERLSNIFKNLKSDEREDFKVYLTNNGLKGIDSGDPFVKKLYELMGETDSQIQES
jgi:hypothetical protein